MNKSSTYCVMPHLAMALQNESDLCCCNINKESWKDNKKQTMYVHSHPLKSVFNSHTRKIISSALDNGIQHKSCQACWDQESVGNSSARQKFNNIFENIQPIPSQPRVLVIKPGNTCNFACRMCNPITSSSWYSDGYELEKANLTSSSWYSNDQSDRVANITFNEYTKTFDTVRNSFNRDNTEFWDTLKEWIVNLVYIDIYGGEPFLSPAMFELLEHGASIGCAKYIELNIHTNASIFNTRYVEILKQYKKVSFRVSIDSHIPSHLEYIRHKADYNQVIENTVKFKNLLGQSPNVNMGITNTITPLNVFYVDETVQWLVSNLELPVAINIVHTPEYDIRHLPIPVKRYLIENTQTTEVTNFLQQTISGCDIEWPKFCKATDRLDQLRKQSFAKTFPDWWKILNPYWVKWDSVCN